MTEKVVSLSSGLVLGMVLALFISISTTQIATSPLHMEYPSMSGLISLNDLQSYHTSSSSPARDTTPVIQASPPANQGQGRIIRIATVTETTDPVLSAAGNTSSEQIASKNWVNEEDPKATGSLQQMHLQHSYLAGGSQASNYAILGQVARQTNFTAIACGASGPGDQVSGGGEQPSIIDDKPQTTGSPAIAQGNPDAEQGEEGEGQSDPAVASFTPRPPAPDTFSNNNTRELVNPSNPNGRDYHDLEEGNGQHNPDHHFGAGPQMQQGHRPETD